MNADEKDAFFLGWRGIAGVAAFALRQRHGQEGEGIGVRVGTVSALPQSVVVRGKEF